MAKHSYKLQVHIPQKLYTVNKAPPLFDLQVQVFFTSSISPSKNECANIDKETVFHSLDCLSYLALSVKYHSQSTGIISKSLLIEKMTLALKYTVHNKNKPPLLLKWVGGAYF